MGSRYVLSVGFIKLTQPVLQNFASEAVIWQQFSHPNILPFFGVFHVPDKIPRVCLVSPWLEEGNVVEFLNRNGDTNCVQLVSDNRNELPCKYVPTEYIT